jgi:antitoxin component HigA of HigAB toxin-antitoxin module
VLGTLVDAYEREHVKIDAPDPVANSACHAIAKELTAKKRSAAR